MDPDTYVSLDRETTGLTPEADAILEIAAVKFRGRETIGTWHSFIDPGRPIPGYIRALTGITPEMVEGAPTFASMTGVLASFLRDTVVVGHRVSFDTGFLSAHGLGISNPTLDTWEMASILFPVLPSHQLGAPASALGSSNPTPHRALADALAARDVFLALVDRASGLEYNLLQQLARILQVSDSGWGPLLERLGGPARAPPPPPPPAPTPH